MREIARHTTAPAVTRDAARLQRALRAAARIATAGGEQYTRTDHLDTARTAHRLRLAPSYLESLVLDCCRGL